MEHSETIVSAVDRLTSDDDLIADGSRVYSLPTISGKHKDLKTISPDTVRFNFLYMSKNDREPQIFDGQFAIKVIGFFIIIQLNICFLQK